MVALVDCVADYGGLVHILLLTYCLCFELVSQFVCWLLDLWGDMFVGVSI